MSNNKIKMYIETGESLPPEVAADINGVMTLDPNQAKMIIPLGGYQTGYKGFGLSMIVDIFCSLLTGMPNGRDVSVMYATDGGRISDKRLLAQFVGAIRIDLFEDVDTFQYRLKDTAQRIRALPQSDNADEEVMVAGDPEKKAAASRMISGIPISHSLKELLLGLIETS
jgi:ureidoglycolate dehydrogenase (NAD+)